jgi:hypothetical protein
MFVVLKDVRIFVFLNSLVMIPVSLPMYVKVAHFCLFCGVVFCSVWLVDTVFGNVMSCSLVEAYRRFGGMYCLHFRHRRVS